MLSFCVFILSRMAHSCGLNEALVIAASVAAWYHHQRTSSLGLLDIPRHHLLYQE
jgi:hypothetical protein